MLLLALLGIALLVVDDVRSSRGKPREPVVRLGTAKVQSSMPIVPASHFRGTIDHEL